MTLLPNNIIIIFRGLARNACAPQGKAGTGTAADDYWAGFGAGGSMERCMGMSFMLDGELIMPAC